MSDDEARPIEREPFGPFTGDAAVDGADDGHLRYLLTAYILGEISDSGRREVEAHLVACEVCRAERDDLTMTLDLCGDVLLDPLAPGEPYSFEARRVERVMAATAAPALSWTPRRVLRIAAVVVATSTVGLGLMSSFMYSGMESRAPSVARSGARGTRGVRTRSASKTRGPKGLLDRIGGAIGWGNADAEKSADGGASAPRSAGRDLPALGMKGGFKEPSQPASVPVGDPGAPVNYTWDARSTRAPLPPAEPAPTTGERDEVDLVAAVLDEKKRYDEAGGPRPGGELVALGEEQKSLPQTKKLEEGRGARSRPEPDSPSLGGEYARADGELREAKAQKPEQKPNAAPARRADLGVVAATDAPAPPAASAPMPNLVMPKSIAEPEPERTLAKGDDDGRFAGRAPEGTDSYRQLEGGQQEQKQQLAQRHEQLRRQLQDAQQAAAASEFARLKGRAEAAAVAEAAVEARSDLSRLSAALEQETTGRYAAGFADKSESGLRGMKEAVGRARAAHEPMGGAAPMDIPAEVASMEESFTDALGAIRFRRVEVGADGDQPNFGNKMRDGLQDKDAAEAGPGLSRGRREGEKQERVEERNAGVDRWATLPETVTATSGDTVGLISAGTAIGTDKNASGKAGDYDLIAGGVRFAETPFVVEDVTVESITVDGEIRLGLPGNEVGGKVLGQALDARELREKAKKKAPESAEAEGKDLGGLLEDLPVINGIFMPRAQAVNGRRGDVSGSAGYIADIEVNQTGAGDASRVIRPIQGMLDDGRIQLGLGALDERRVRAFEHYKALDPSLTFRAFAARGLELTAPAVGDEGLGQDRFRERYGVNPFVDTRRDHLSTFAMDVDTASFTRARGLLRAGSLPDPKSVRVEEFVNSFPHDEPVLGNDAFQVFSEGAPAPFGAQGTDLVKIAVKARDLREGERRAAVLTFAVDTSGSMILGQRLVTVKRALRTLLGALNPDDQVAVVAYGAEAYLALPHTPAREQERILGALGSLAPGGNTNVEAGLDLAYRIADEARTPKASNRVILCSDGVATDGARGADALVDKVKVFARRGVDLSVVGFGRDRYDDALLERLADEGNGNYAYVDSGAEAARLFETNLPATLQVLARDAKIQVDWNPETVSHYRLLGYENRDVADSDFRNDAVDAGEVGPGTTVTALYEIQRRPGVHGDLGTVFVRYHATDTGRVEELDVPLKPGLLRSQLAQTTGGFKTTAAAAELAEQLRESYWARDGAFRDVVDLLAQVDPKDRDSGWSDLLDMTLRAQALRVRRALEK